MIDDTVRFVQFPHPGPELKSPADTLPWNVGDHGRKFLRNSGRFVDGNDRAGSADLVFWGEWEPPSRIEHRWPPGGGNPRALHQPYWFRPAPGWRRQNTDPWVFGTHMLYSNCRQGIEPMRSLPPGSVICFGSTLKREFVLDTVFVIASAQPWTPADPGQLDVDEAFKVCTAESINAGGSTCASCGGPEETGCAERHDSFTLYRGATFEDQVHGMYSFVPALPVTGGDPPRFARPVIHLPDLIDPTVVMAAWGSKRPLSIAEVGDAWCAVRQQVLDAGLALAVQLDTPPEQSSSPIIPASREGSLPHDLSLNVERANLAADGSPPEVAENRAEP